MEFEDATPKQIFLYLILPLGFSALLFFFSFHLKQKELEAYFHPGFRITIVVFACIIGFLSLMMLWMTMIIRILMFFKLAYNTKKNSTGGNILGLGTLLFFIPVIYLGFKLSMYNASLEDDALAARGKTAKVIITGSERKRSKHGHFYEYYFKLPAYKNQAFEGNVQRDHDVLKPGDTVTIYFLPTNPDIYGEIN